MGVEENEFGGKRKKFEERKKMDLEEFEVMKEKDNQTYCCQTHLGHILKHGDSVVGYEIGSINCTEDLQSLKGQESLPDVILIRKQYDEKHKKKKIWKLKR